jgi:hypothetical protein
MIFLSGRSICFQLERLMTCLCGDDDGDDDDGNDDDGDDDDNDDGDDGDNDDDDNNDDDNDDDDKYNGEFFKNNISVIFMIRG